MFALLGILLRFLVPSTICVGFFWCVVVRYGPIEDLDPNSLAVRLFGRRRKIELSDDKSSREIVHVVSKVPTQNRFEHTDQSDTELLDNQKKALLAIIRNRLEQSMPLYQRASEKRYKDKKATTSVTMLYPGFPGSPATREPFPTESDFPSKLVH